MLVTDVPSYPQFLPWCERAEVLEARRERHDGAPAACPMPACTTPSRRATSMCPTSRSIVALVDGPFSVLDGTWLFRPLGTPPETTSQACRIEFDMRYAFSSKALEAVVSPVFDRIANTFVDSFVKRAEQVYGAALTSPRLRVEVVYSPAPGVIDSVELRLPPGARSQQALRESGLLERHRACIGASNSRSAYGASAARQRCAARPRPRRDLSTAAGGSEGSAAPALPGAPRALSAQAVTLRRRASSAQSDAMIWRAR